MKSSRPICFHHSSASQSGITLFQLVVFLGLAVIVGLLVLPTRNYYHVHGRMADQLNNGRSLYLSMRNYASETAHDGAFPTYADPKSKAGLFATSNDAFTTLLPRYLDDKMIFGNKPSAWCKKYPRDPATANVVLPGENDWCYMRGLTDKSNTRWPLLANAFVPGTTHYVKDPSRPGGVWKGTDAVVIWAGGSAENVETKEQGDHYFVRRTDKPTANAFVKDDEWLAGENVKLLYPVAP